MISASFVQLLPRDLLRQDVANKLLNRISLNFVLLTHVITPVLWNIEENQLVTLDTCQFAYLVAYITRWRLEKSQRHGIHNASCVHVVFGGHCLYRLMQGLRAAKRDHAPLFVQIARIIVDVIERLGKPSIRKVLARRVVQRLAATVGRYGSTIWVDYHETWNTIDAKGV